MKTNALIGSLLAFLIILGGSVLADGDVQGLLTVGNFSTEGEINATGNITTSGSFEGDGSGLTGVAAASASIPSVNITTSLGGEVTGTYDSTVVHTPGVNITTGFGGEVTGTYDNLILQWLTSDWFDNELNQSSSPTFSGLTVNGNVTIIGTTFNATVTNQYLNGSFLPDLTNTFNIGSPTKLWATIYAAAYSGVPSVNITTSLGGEVTGTYDSTVVHTPGVNITTSFGGDASGTYDALVVPMRNVTGNYTITGDMMANAYYGDGSALINLPGGMDNVTGDFIVSEDISIGEKVIHVGNTNTYLAFGIDALRFYGNSKSIVYLGADGSAGFTINENKDNSIDFKYSGSTESYLIYADALTDKVGIGTNEPNSTLDIVGNLSVSENISAQYFIGNGSALTGISGGDSWSDLVDADIVPDGNNARDIGTSAVYFNEIFGNYLYAYGALEVGQEMYHVGDGDTKVKFETNNVIISAGGAEGIDMYEGTIDYIRIGEYYDLLIFETNTATRMVINDSGTFVVGNLSVAGDLTITGGYINHTLADGVTRYFSNGCTEIVNATGIYWVC